MCVCVCVCLLSHARLCETMDCSPPGSSVHGIFQARILEQVAIFPAGDLPDPKIKSTYLGSSALHADSFTTEPLGKPYLRDGSGY